MFVKSLLSLFALAFAMAFAHPALAATEPTMHDIYTAAEAGKLTEAQTMIDAVLRAHPNSAKAHYVQSELMVKQGKLRGAEAELATAERLAPGLPFAKPEAVRSLRAQFTSASSSSTQSPSRTPMALPQQNFEPASSGTPWTLLMAGAGLIAVIVFAMRFMARRNAVAAPMAYPAYSGSPGMMGGAGTAPGYGPGYGPAYGPGYGPGGAPAGGGMGSGIMGGLATGAALGAGMVAGQALMHHFTDSNGNRVEAPTGHNSLAPEAPSNYDMGGQDFGVADAGSSWDSGGGSDGGGGGDW